MKRTICITLAAALPAVAAMAQSSSVTIYGTVGLGITHVNSSSGGSRWLEESGVLRAGRLGFTGTEDLGGGLSAVFTLEQGILADAGAAGQGGRLFGRQSWVGLSSKSLGAITLGRQYDMMNRLVRYSTAGDIGAVYGFHHGDYDRVSGFRIDNSIKYVSPVFGGGAQLALLTAPGEDTGQRTISGGLSYANGPLDIAVSFASTKRQTINPSADLGVATFFGATAGSIVADKVTPRGFGVNYNFGSFKPHFAYTSVRIERSGKSTSLDSMDIGVSYPIGLASIGAGMTHSKLESASWDQYSVGYIYNLSKRTKIYGNINYQKASGTARNAVMPTLVAASGRSQLVPHVGLTHDF
ncbi:Outer membrane protein (porin) [Rhodoferax sp. OV413]|uniref:porin n=1 Tax=Rhodoferax sp. OV413 TaxID=1855285 RepID=UPI0008860A28|nr:porin [Rhodoferax sp. OV413]SDP61163.1 Outer membrane protein (porin) [Rhodoferax sp. OV413]